VEYLGYHDKLTGLYNRRFLEEEMSRLDTARNLPISLIMGDVNGLKLMNDVFGHDAGDLLLKEVAESLKTACRNGEIISRQGGGRICRSFAGS
jgi:diguanylate cyclase (GGDEF)-like protein